MVLTKYLEFEDIPGGADFLEDVRKRYDYSIVEAIINSGLKLRVTLNPLPILSFKHSAVSGTGYDYHISSQGVYRFNLQNRELGKIVGFEADSVSVLIGEDSDERYDPNTNLEACILGIHCDHKKINPDTYKERINMGRLDIFIEYAKLAEFDF